MKEVEIVHMEVMWVKISTIVELFQLGKTHVSELIKEMRESKRWRNSVVMYHKVTRVNLKDFETFWRSKSQLRGV